MGRNSRPGSREERKVAVSNFEGLGEDAPGTARSGGTVQSGGTGTARSVRTHGTLDSGTGRPGTAGSTDSLNSDSFQYNEDRNRLFGGPRRHGFDGTKDKNGKRSGFGIFYYENGDVYEGNWKDDQRHGKGKHYTLTGDMYDCIWMKDVIHDRRAFIRYANGIEYTGNYERGKKLGNCVYTYQDGRVEKGYWKVSGRYIEDVPGWFPPTLSRKLWTCVIDFFCPKKGLKSLLEDYLEWRKQWFIDEEIRLKEEEEKRIRLEAEEAERQRIKEEDAARKAAEKAQREAEEATSVSSITPVKAAAPAME